MEFLDFLRRCKRSNDVWISYRKAFLLLTIIFGLIFYLGLWFFRLTLFRKSVQSDPVERCLSNHLDLFTRDLNNFDAYVKREYIFSDSDKPYLPFIGNGYVGLTIDSDSPIFITTDRILSLRVPFYPMVVVNLNEEDSSSAIVTQYTSGIVQKFECLRKKDSSIDVSFRYYVHRTLPSVLVQDVKIVNPLDEDIYLDLIQRGAAGWNGATKNEYHLNTNGISDEVSEFSGGIQTEESDMIAIVVLQSKVPSSIRVKARSSNFIHVVTSIQYAEVNLGAHQLVTENLSIAARKDLDRALSVNYRKFRDDHVKIWRQLWSPGLSISYSKAVNSLNGDKINATIYYVLSHSRAPLYEVDTTENKQAELMAKLNQPDQCYAGHHTLQNLKLWSSLSTVGDVIRVVSLWKVTLEKQGCQTMMNAGADGVIQAMLLSFGAFKFSGHHLEFGMQPKDLHRDYLFRRISYSNGTHINVSVVVGENNKAVIFVVLDRSDRNYYACDGGCLDPPVQLSQEKVQFPVKRTDPHTAILYITSNKKHMIELKDAIHFQEIVEAPAHEHHVIALHRHGHHFGGLPAMFWISITFLVAVFHLFLFKLIYNEYCTGQDKFRARHSL